MSFFKKLLGLGEVEAKSDEPKMLGEDDYKGFIISAIEMKTGSEYQLCGRIEKEIDGELKVQNFIRADRLSSIEEVLKFTHKKGRQIIDEQGEALFDNGW
jgi:hypothetical protein